MAKPATVRAQALGGTWETIGSDRAAGVWVENLVTEYDESGPSKCSFDLRRRPGQPWPDIGANTPIDVEIAGVHEWSGRVSDTPSHSGQDQVISVQCEGWQFHLDDDAYEKFYVHSRLGDWKDTRTFPGANLGLMLNRFSVNAGDGVIQIGCPKGTEWPTSTGVGVTLDLGPANTIKGFSAHWEINGASAFQLYFRLTDTPNCLALPVIDLDVEGWPLLVTDGASTTSPGKRYLHIFLWNPRAAITPTDDAFVSIKAVTAYAETDYVAFPAGIANLKASDVILDALAMGTSQLSSDMSLVAPTATNLNDFFQDGPRTPREVIDNANTFHNYKLQVDVDRRPVFGPKPARPIFEIADPSSVNGDDPSANSGADVYDQVLVQGTDQSGQRVRSLRTTTARNAVTARGFHHTKRLDIGFTLPSDGVLAAAIGDAWLADNHLTPFKGTRTLVGDGSIRDLLTGQSIGLHTLGRKTMELIRFPDQIDPDTGDLGRDGRMIKVRYIHAEDTAEITIDNSRADFEALLARMAAVVGSG